MVSKKRLLNFTFTNKTNKSGAVKHREIQHALHVSARVVTNRKCYSLGWICQAARFRVVAFLWTRVFNKIGQASS